MSTTLFVRGLPKFISETAATELFSHYGAEHIRLAKGKLKGTAFVKFPDEATTNKALTSLNGKTILGGTLVVELAHSTEEEAAKRQKGEVSEKNQQQSLLERKQASIAANLGIDYPSPPWLEYRYPPPNPAVLDNIARTLWSVPKFYEQTLHLMNKMNLPPPFGPPNPALPGYVPITVTKPTVPLPSMAPVGLGRLGPAPSASSIVRVPQRQDVSRAIEEEDDTIVTEPAAKRIKVSETQHAAAASSQTTPEAVVVGDYGVQAATKNSLKIGKISAAAPGQVPPSQTQTTEIVEAEDRVASAPKFDNSNRKVLTDAEIYLSKLTPQRTNRTCKLYLAHSIEILEMPRFASYSAGEPSPKLFIKNLAKGVKQEDLEYIFGRYFDNDEEMRDKLQIKIMTGRHQGSAFATFPSVELAQRALFDIHGFVWKDKPMILEFGKVS